MIDFSNLGIGSTAASSKSNTGAPPTPSSPTSLTLSSRDDDDILDQLARQTANALKGGRTTLDEESTSSEDSAPNVHPASILTYDIMSLSF